jgi:hypothetical protein
MVSHRPGNPATTLTMSQAPAAPTTSTAAAGRDAYLSALDSSRLSHWQRNGADDAVLEGRVRGPCAVGERHRRNGKDASYRTGTAGTLCFLVIRWDNRQVADW